MAVKGAGVLARRIQGLGPKVRAGIADAVEESAQEVLRDMKRFAPKDTGSLSAALTVAIDRKGMRARIGLPRQGLAGDNFYARFIEEGTKGGSKSIKDRKTGKIRTVTFPARPARPFMKPALDLNKRKIRQRIARALRTALRQGVR